MRGGGGHSAAVVTAPEELPGILEALDSATYAAMDTEFPGFLHQTPRFASPRERQAQCRQYEAHPARALLLRRRWAAPDLQISFRDFDVASPSDARSEASVELLKRSGVDLARTRREGVGRRKPRWVTFQGLYDAAYLVKLLTGAPLLPKLPGFARLVGATLGRVIDVKYLTRFCGGFHLGLARLADTARVKLEGGAAHQASVDALLTARSSRAEGFLHGIEEERILPKSSEETEQEEELLLICPLYPPSTLFLTPAIVFPPMLIGMAAPPPGFYVLE
ncbi:unnamed protein product [Spirodela intermedia]|uniref:Uncharacterized protein n=1 Tax=Spirodela intermedia TaxID=51605 RepID=A0A7I8J3Z5_SPIIN|nr:unnamed protein product [Spirodela intermedia]CAA6664101.1 unnamed protein product [Spirodela intermedia]